MMREMIHYLHVAENLFLYSNPSLGTDMYNIVLHYLVEGQEVSGLYIITSLFCHQLCEVGCYYACLAGI